MENDEMLLAQEYFKSSFNKQDVASLPTFKKWKEAKKNEGKKIVRYPWCYGYEILVKPTNYECSMCGKLYCQKCLQKCVKDEVEHNHNRSCCSKFRGLIDIMVDWGKDRHSSCKEYFIAIIVFLFGNHILYSFKYFDFFKKNKITDNICVHWFFTITDLIANICYCIAFNITYFEFFFFIFFPGIFIPCYRDFIAENWLIVLEFGVDESPITELTVRGKGYPYPDDNSDDYSNDNDDDYDNNDNDFLW